MARSNSAKNARNSKINNQNELTLSMINNNNGRESSPIRRNEKNKDKDRDNIS